MIQITHAFCVLFICDYNKKLILISGIPLSGGHCILFTQLNITKYAFFTSYFLRPPGVSRISMNASIMTLLTFPIDYRSSLCLSQGVHHGRVSRDLRGTHGYTSTLIRFSGQINFREFDSSERQISVSAEILEIKQKLRFRLQNFFFGFGRNFGSKLYRKFWFKWP